MLSVSGCDHRGVCMVLGWRNGYGTHDDMTHRGSVAWIQVLRTNPMYTHNCEVDVSAIANRIVQVAVLAIFRMMNETAKTYLENKSLQRGHGRWGSKIVDVMLKVVVGKMM